MSHAPRIAPVDPPYEPAAAAALKAMMPADSPIDPLKLFRLFLRHPAMANAMQALGSFVLGRGGRTLASRDREIVIHRVCARCGCEYEWGVHAVAFGARVGLDDAQLAATTRPGADDPAWSEHDRLLIRLVDELHDGGTVSDALWERLRDEWNEAQLLELLLVAGWYHAISYLANGARVERETWAARFPAKTRMALILGAHHTSFPVKDIERSKAFYGGLLGLVEKPRPPALVAMFPGAWYQAGRCEVHLIQYPDGLDVGAPPPSLNPMARHAAFAIADYASTVAYLKEHGVTVLETSAEIGQMWVRDPDGHILELIVDRG